MSEEINSTKFSPLVIKQQIKEFFNNSQIDKSLLDQELNERSGLPVLLNPIDF